MKKYCFISVFLLLSVTRNYSQAINAQVFTWHSGEKTVTLYEDDSLTNKRIEIYPNTNENMVGCIVYIDSEVGRGLRVAIEPSGYFFIAKGTVAVNTRNYNDDRFFLFAQPDYNSDRIMQSPKQQMVVVYGIQNGWLYVEAISEDGVNIMGWLAPDMQCGNPYTPCN